MVGADDPLPVYTSSPTGSNTSGYVGQFMDMPRDLHHEDGGYDPSTTEMPSFVEPQDIRLEDGGYEAVVGTVSSSPIRTFTRIDDLDPQLRAGFQNQFQHKGGRGKRRSSSRGQQTTFGCRTGGNWTERDGFDELLGKPLFLIDTYF